MKYPIILVLIFAYSTAFAQAEKSVELSAVDVKAVNILESSKSAIESYQAVEVDFLMVIDVPDQEKITQKGFLLQKGSSYRLELPDRLIISNGKTIWNYLKDINEVQINDVESFEETAFNTPLDWLKIYENDEFVYALTDQLQAKGGLWDQIEFKSTDRTVDFSKIRLSVDGESMPQMLEFFYKDGVKMTLHLEDFAPNFSLDESKFSFDASQYPDVHIEDLRF